MSKKNKPVMHFVSLRTVARELGARTHKEFLKDLRSLTPQERREVADLVKKDG